MPLDDVAAEGDRLATLKELRGVLARQIVAAEKSPLLAQQLPALTGRLQSVLAEIEAIEPEAKEGTALDEFTKRRAERETSRPSGTAKRSQRR